MLAAAAGRGIVWQQLQEWDFNAAAGFNNLVAAAGRGIGKEQLQEGNFGAAAGQRILGEATAG